MTAARDLGEADPAIYAPAESFAMIEKDVVVTTAKGKIAGRAYDVTPLGAECVASTLGPYGMHDGCSGSPSGQ